MAYNGLYCIFPSTVIWVLSLLKDHQWYFCMFNKYLTTGQQLQQKSWFVRFQVSGTIFAWWLISGFWFDSIKCSVEKRCPRLAPRKPIWANSRKWLWEWKSGWQVDGILFFCPLWPLLRSIGFLIDVKNWLNIIFIRISEWRAFSNPLEQDNCGDDSPSIVLITAWALAPKGCRAPAMES